MDFPKVLPAYLPVALIAALTPSPSRGDVLIDLGLVDSAQGAVAQLVRALNS